MHRLRIVSYNVRPAQYMPQKASKMYNKPNISRLRDYGAEIRIYHPAQERAIVNAAWDALTVIVAPHVITQRKNPTIHPIELSHPLMRSDTFCEPAQHRKLQQNINRVVSLLDNMDGTMAQSLSVRIEPAQLAGWLSQWEHHVKHAAEEYGDFDINEAQEYLYKKLVTACYYC